MLTKILIFSPKYLSNYISHMIEECFFLLKLIFIKYLLLSLTSYSIILSADFEVSKVLFERLNAF
jgi:hypothetical protein